MIEFIKLVEFLTDIKISEEKKKLFVVEHNITDADLIDVVNYITIERNFYNRICCRFKQEKDEVHKS